MLGKSTRGHPNIRDMSESNYTVSDTHSMMPGKRMYEQKNLKILDEDNAK